MRKDGGMTRTGAHAWTGEEWESTVIALEGRLGGGDMMGGRRHPWGSLQTTEDTPQMQDVFLAVPRAFVLQDNLFVLSLSLPVGSYPAERTWNISTRSIRYCMIDWRQQHAVQEQDSEEKDSKSDRE